MAKKKRTKSQNGRRSRMKGQAFERDVALALRPIFPEARRHFEFRKQEARDGKDLIHTGLYRFQLKKLRKYASISKIKEAQADEMCGEVPVLVTAGDGEPAMAVVPFVHFVRLLASEKRREELEEYLRSSRLRFPERGILRGREVSKVIIDD